MRIQAESVPVLLIGDKGKVSDEIVSRANRETLRVKGVITFSDGSKMEGTREVVFGDPVIRVGEEEVEGMFQPIEYYG